MFVDQAIQASVVSYLFELLFTKEFFTIFSSIVNVLSLFSLGIQLSSTFFSVNVERVVDKDISVTKHFRTKQIHEKAVFLLRAEATSRTQKLLSDFYAEFFPMIDVDDKIYHLNDRMFYQALCNASIDEFGINSLYDGTLFSFLVSFIHFVPSEFRQSLYTKLANPTPLFMA